MDAAQAVEASEGQKFTLMYGWHEPKCGWVGLREGNDILERRLLDALFLALETSHLFKCGQDEATVQAHVFLFANLNKYRDRASPV